MNGSEKRKLHLGPKFTSKLSGVGESIFATMTRLSNQEGAINLSQGFPDFNCPPELIDLVYRHMKEGRNQYAPMPGVPELRKKISRKVKSLHNVNYDPDKEITVTAGATQAIFLAITTLVKEGEEAIIMEPAYDSYAPGVLVNEGIPKFYQLSPPDYKINWYELKRLINFHTKLVIINTPHNPSGTIFSREDMEELEKLVAEYDLFVISDEVYEHIVFDDHAHQSACRFPKLREKTFVISSFGKTYHTTGWKAGYVLAPQGMTNEFRKVYQFAMFGVTTPVQHAYADFLDHQDHYLQLKNFYQQKRDLFAGILEDSRFKRIPCNGTYFQCVDYSAISDEPDEDFATRLTREHKVAAIPVSVFYHRKQDHKIVRFCFAKEEETLKKAGEILCKL